MTSSVKRLLIPSAALFWGLQFAFLQPALALLRHSGAPASAVVNTRAIVSFAWVAGPPLATAIIGWSGNRAILAAIGVVALLNIATTARDARRPVTRRRRSDCLG